MEGETGTEGPASAWNPDVGAGIPGEFRALETIFRPECAFTAADEIDELAALTGLPHQELTVFRPQRLALHEIIIRVSAAIAVAEGEEEEDFGRNFRRIATTLRDAWVASQMGRIEAAYAELAAVLVAMAPPVRALCQESALAARQNMLA